MASTISKKVGGHIYYSLAESTPAGGKPRIVSHRNLGKAADIEAAMDGAQVLPERTRHLAFGALAGALSLIRRIRSLWHALGVTVGATVVLLGTATWRLSTQTK